jgi:hypothetical protein
MNSKIIIFCNFFLKFKLETYYNDYLHQIIIVVKNYKHTY